MVHIRGYTLISFDIFTQPWRNHYNKNNEHYHHLWKFLMSLANPSLHPSPSTLPCAEANTDLFLSQWVSLHFLEFYIMESYDMHSVFCLASFTQHDLRFTHVVEYINSSFFSFLNSRVKYIKHSEWLPANSKCWVNGNCYYTNIKDPSQLKTL